MGHRHLSAQDEYSRLFLITGALLFCLVAMQGEVLHQLHAKPRDKAELQLNGGRSRCLVSWRVRKQAL